MVSRSNGRCSLAHIYFQPSSSSSSRPTLTNIEKAPIQQSYWKWGGDAFESVHTIDASEISYTHTPGHQNASLAAMHFRRRYSASISVYIYMYLYELGMVSCFDQEMYAQYVCMYMDAYSTPLGLAPSTCACMHVVMMYVHVPPRMYIHRVSKYGRCTYLRTYVYIRRFYTLALSVALLRKQRNLSSQGSKWRGTPADCFSASPSPSPSPSPPLTSEQARLCFRYVFLGTLLPSYEQESWSMFRICYVPPRRFCSRFIDPNRTAVS
jgi:hypothetical protein